jgi:hypothetical protein
VTLVDERICVSTLTDLQGTKYKVKFDKKLFNIQNVNTLVSAFLRQNRRFLLTRQVTECRSINRDILCNSEGNFI